MTLRRVLFLLTILFSPILLWAQPTYTWNGGTSSAWTLPANWTPSRTTPAAADILVLDGSTTSTFTITAIATETVKSLLVTGSGSFTLSPTGSQVLTLTNTSGNAFQVDIGSELTEGVAGNPLGITIPATGTASIGGQLNLGNGNFGVGAGTLILHDNSSPLIKTGGQVSMSAGSVLQFGLNGASETTATIVLPSGVFSGSINIATIVMNRLNGATLNNQLITLSNGVTFTDGDLNVPNSGTLIFGTTATDPTASESLNSKIVGYAEMQSRVITTGAIDFLGFNMAAGADNLNNIIIKRLTGQPITFNTVPSIGSVWNISTGNPPTSGRNINFKWLSTFDNGYTIANKFQTYINDGSPGWTSLGTKQFVTSGAADLRVSAPVPTTKFGFDFTLTDDTQTLPVELIDFSAQASAKGVQLSWATASELNSDYFIVEKSRDAKTFEKLAIIYGHGTSRVRNDYTVQDEKPVVGNTYYRLTEVDLDGSVHRLKVIDLDFTTSRKLDIYPNPVLESQVTFELNFNPETEPESPVVVSIADMRGIILSEFVLRQSRVTLTNELSAGIYLVRLRSKDLNTVSRLIVR